MPIVIERTMWWPGPSLTSNFWYEAHNSPGATTATRWLVPGAEIGGPDGAQPYVLIANPGTTAGQVRVTVLTDTGPTAVFPVTVAAKSRTTIPLFGGGAPSIQSVLVESVGNNPVPIVVEHATYSSPGGVLWASGGNALAAPLP